MTDANGATNFTQQFAINGQRGVEATFAMDGADISDPEMGGSTFSNFNVDAVQEIQSQSGWMPAEIGRGAAGFTNIVTRSGSSGFHGSFFEFLRNSALDARNYFDHSSIANPGRLPPFRRNEFGFTNGGPVILPGIYNGAGKTFYFGQYQGFRQVLGTTQVFPVPTAQERAGLDTTAFPGDTLTVPVDPGIARVLARYPLPNNPLGSYGVHTYASSSPVVTDADQFSVRLDHRISDKSQLFARFNFNNLNGPTTNPDQTVIDPAFAIRYIDRQRNLVVTYTRTVSPRLIWESSFSATRATPSFPTTDFTDPAVKFNDGSYEPFNQPAGTVISVYGNLFQTRQNLSFTTTRHAFKLGGEVRLNRDTTYFGISPNGEYDFGGGTAYSPVDIPSQSGMHNIRVGDPLPDTLSGLLSGSPFVYTVAVAPPYFSGGAHIGAAAITGTPLGSLPRTRGRSRLAWCSTTVCATSCIRRVTERAKRTSGIAFSTTPTGVAQQFVINPQPGYRFNLDGLGPRVQLDWLAWQQIHLRAGGAITTIPPNLYQDNSLTGTTPFAVYPRLTSAPTAPIPYGFQITPDELPLVYTPDRAGHFRQRHQSCSRQHGDGSESLPAGSGRALTGPPDHSADASIVSTRASATPTFRPGLWAWSATSATWSPTRRILEPPPSSCPGKATSTAILGRGPASLRTPSSTQAGNIIGGFGTENVVTSTSHSSYHALQTSLQGTVPHGGPGVQASYTWSKSLDETSSVVGGFVTGGTGAIVADIAAESLRHSSGKRAVHLRHSPYLHP